MSRARRTSWVASELRLPACAQSGFGSQGSWAGGSPRRAISSVQVSCRRRSSSSVSLSTTSRHVCPSTALILCTTWGRRVWDWVTAGTAGSTRAAAPPRAGPGQQAGRELRQRWAAGPRGPWPHPRLQQLPPSSPWAAGTRAQAARAREVTTTVFGWASGFQSSRVCMRMACGLQPSSSRCPWVWV